MEKGVLTFIDTVGVQDYIFRTNALKQIAGASYLVECATRDWLVKALPEGRHNVLDLNNPKKPFTGQHLETDSNLLAEVYLAGGGNALIAFRSPSDSRDFLYALTRRVLVEAPGLNLAVASIPFDICNDPLGGPGGALDRLAQVVDRAKMNLPRNQGALGLGVTLQCDFTHAPAVGTDKNQPISAEVAAKLAASSQATQRLKNLLDRIPQELWERAGLKKDFPLQLDDLGSTAGEKSVLAVIHTDGNGMGERFREISNTYLQAKENRRLIEEQQKLSFSIQAQAEQALVETIRYLLERTFECQKSGAPWLFNQIELSTHLLPLRPVLYGGDDATFICDGRIGLWLANEYLSQVSSSPLYGGKKLYSRAGVAIVKAHYPFARAYHLAEDLAAQAKRFVREIRQDLLSQGKWDDKVDGVNALDWQIAISGQVRPLEEIRDYEYQVTQGSLTMRPVYQGNLSSAGQLSANLRWRSWENLLHIHQRFEEDWGEMRNKVKALSAVLADGPDAVENFVSLIDQKLPDVPGLSEREQTTGWYQKRCVYFDAVELFDLLSVQLEETHA